MLSEKCVFFNHHFAKGNEGKSKEYRELFSGGKMPESDERMSEDSDLAGKGSEARRITAERPKTLTFGKSLKRQRDAVR